jgi:hypothetical protein
MEKEFIPYEQALALKELGFDEPCLAYYLAGGIRFKEYKDSQNKNSAFYNNTVCSIPLYQQAFRWFREKYDLQCWPEVTGSNRYSCRYDGNDETGKRWVGYLKDYNGQSVLYSKYEEAELECLKKLIEIVKE